MPLNLEQLTVRVAPERIGFVKFIMEGYDGLAILSTIADQGNGNITLRFHPARRKELQGVLSNLQIDWLLLL